MIGKKQASQSYKVMTKTMDEAELIAYLEANTDFLTRHYDALKKKGVAFPASSPAKVINITSKIAEKARAEARKATQANQSLLDVAAENMLHWRDLHLATLGLLACNDLEAFAQFIHEELPLIFGLTSCHIMMPQAHAIARAEQLSFLTLTADQIATMIEGDAISYMGPVPTALASEVASDTKSLALIRLPDQLPAPVRDCLLVLGGRDRHNFGKDKGQSILIHLSEMVGVRFLGLLEAPRRQSQS